MTTIERKEEHYISHTHAYTSRYCFSPFSFLPAMPPFTLIEQLALMLSHCPPEECVSFFFFFSSCPSCSWLALLFRLFSLSPSLSSFSLHTHNSTKHENVNTAHFSLLIPSTPHPLLPLTIIPFPMRLSTTLPILPSLSPPLNPTLLPPSLPLLPYT